MYSTVKTHYITYLSNIDKYQTSLLPVWIFPFSPDIVQSPATMITKMLIPVAVTVAYKILKVLTVSQQAIKVTNSDRSDINDNL